MRGQSQTKLAGRLGLSYQQVQKYETGANRIAANKLFDISRILGVAPGYFFEGLEDKRGGGTEEMDLKAIRIVTMIAKISDEEIKKCLYRLVKALVAFDAGAEK
jgi:transcriptional regulator with XRE-family HTH domain